MTDHLGLPPTLAEHVGYLAVLAGQRSQAAFEAAIEPLGLVPGQYDYLVVAHEAGPLSQRGLARTLGVDPARIVAMTDELERRGLVVREVDPADRRRNLVRLTRSGRALVARASKASAQVEAELLAAVAPRDREALRRALTALVGDALDAPG